MLNDNYALHTDKYQINMMYAHWQLGSLERRAIFEVYFRKLPFGNGFAVFAGLERIVNYMRHLQFTEDDIAYLREQEEQYDELFLQTLLDFKFTGHMYAVPEGTLVFPNVPLMRVEARIFEAQLIETALLNMMNFQTLIATKAARIKQVAPDDGLLEFGSRRAQECDAAIWGARSAYISGFHATSNLRSGQLFGIPTKGTHSHSWVQAHESEAEAFHNYAKAMPDDVTLLVDTYDTLKSGVPNAIETARWLKQQGKKLNAIRLDSGDLAYLSQRARKMLDEAGFPEVKIVASNDLDEHIISNLKAQGAKIDTWGVGTNLITAADQPALGGVYKLVALMNDGEFSPVIKVSGNPEKVTTPGYKTPYRLIDQQTGKAIADYIALHDETNILHGERIKLFDPVHSYLHKHIEGYEARPLLEPIIQDGNIVYDLPTLTDIRIYHEQQLSLFWPEYLRLLNPELYRVNLSTPVWKMKQQLLTDYATNE